MCQCNDANLEHFFLFALYQDYFALRNLQINHHVRSKKMLSTPGSETLIYLQTSENILSIENSEISTGL